jgi:hypothetical protein
MVAETCGGNCYPTMPWGQPDCPSRYGSHGQEMQPAKKPIQKSKFAGQYAWENRCAPSQKIKSMKPISGNGIQRSIKEYEKQHGECLTPSNVRQGDWCSGYYSHFDLNQNDKRVQQFLHSNGIGVVNYKKIIC